MELTRTEHNDKTYRYIQNIHSDFWYGSPCIVGAVYWQQPIFPLNYYIYIIESINKNKTVYNEIEAFI